MSNSSHYQPRVTNWDIASPVWHYYQLWHYRDLATSVFHLVAAKYYKVQYCYILRRRERHSILTSHRSCKNTEALLYSAATLMVLCQRDSYRSILDWRKTLLYHCYKYSVTVAFRWYIVRETVAVVSQLSQKGLFVSLRRSFIGLQLVLLRTWQLVLGSHCDNFMLFSLKKNTYYCQTNQGVSIIKTAILAILTQLALTQQFNKPRTTRHHRFILQTDVSWEERSRVHSSL